jgi:hypothetical protein
MRTGEKEAPPGIEAGWERWNRPGGNKSPVHNIVSIFCLSLFEHRVWYFGWAHPAAKARRMKVETLLAVVLVVRAKTDEPPPCHLRCPHCERFTLVRIGRLARAPPTCTR